MTPEDILYDHKYLGLARPLYTIENFTPGEVYELTKDKFTNSDIVRASTEFHNHLIELLSKHSAVHSQDEALMPEKWFKDLARTGPFYKILSGKLNELRKEYHRGRDSNLRTRLRFSPDTLTPEEREEATQSMKILVETGRYRHANIKTRKILEAQGINVPVTPGSGFTKGRYQSIVKRGQRKSQHSLNVPPVNPRVVIDLSTEAESEYDIEGDKSKVAIIEEANMLDEIATTSKTLAIETANDVLQDLEVELFGSIDNPEDIEACTNSDSDVEMEFDYNSAPKDILAASTVTKTSRANVIDLELKKSQRAPLLLPNTVRSPGLSVPMSELEIAEALKKKKMGGKVRM